MANKTIRAPLVANKSVFFPIKALVFDPLPDEHPCYRLVGLIAAETARIERLLEQSICNVGEMDLKAGACLTGQMIGPTPRFNALLQLAMNRGMSDGIIKRISTLSGHGSDKFERRNRVVHDPWLRERTSEEPHQFRAKAKKDPTFGAVPVSEKDLENTLTEIRKHRDDVNSLVSDIWTELRPA
jgi:hypothetical protein